MKAAQCRYRGLSRILFQTGVLRSKFVEILQSYQQVERDYRARYKQRVERQFKIGTPYLTYRRDSMV